MFIVTLSNVILIPIAIGMSKDDEGFQSVNRKNN